MFYAAFDVSLRSVAICIIDQDGKVRLERSVPSEVPDLVRCLRAFGEPIHQVGLEAGTLTQHLTYGLTEAGFDVVCMEARQVNAALSAMRNKTDKHDARGIAQILRSGWYSRVHVKSVESQHLRALISARKVMQRKCIDLENEIRGLLKIFGVKLPLRLAINNKADIWPLQRLSYKLGVEHDRSGSFQPQKRSLSVLRIGAHHWYDIEASRGGGARLRSSCRMRSPGRGRAAHPS